MNDNIELQRDINEQLNKALLLFKKRGREYAECERAYRVALQQEMVKLRVEKVPVTIINDLARGTEHVANLKFNRDVAEAEYKSCIEAVQVKKLQLRIIREENAEDRRGM